MARVLVVDDQDTIRHFISKALEDEGHEVVTAPSGEAALGFFGADPPDAVILDLKLPGMSGLEVLGKIKATERETVVIMITAYGEISSAVKAMRMGAFDYIPKPVDLDHLMLSLRRALESKKYYGQGWQDTAKALGCTVLFNDEKKKNSKSKEESEASAEKAKETADALTVAIAEVEPIG